MPSPNMLVRLSDTDRVQLEGYLFEFDRSWSPNALAARVDQLPPGNSVYRQAALVELVKIDLERQWQAGNRRTVEDYLRQFPDLGSQGAVSTDLLLAEYEARHRFGTPAEVQDFQRRFPALLTASEPLPELSTAPNLADRLPEAGVDTSRTGSAADTGVHDAGQLTTLPEQFGRYRILKRLGGGGMGTVYLAHDGKLDRNVALKVPKLDHAGDREWINRFYQEARAAAALHHRNICSIFDIGEVDGVHYISMAWIEGESLADWTRGKKQISIRDAVSVVYRLALALQEAHARGVIHRDLKPANVMMDHEQEPVITDFGLARQLDKDEHSRLTHPGMILGTPAYMSPEQISGEIERVQAPSDIYSLGVILYELLTGELPFSGTVSAYTLAAKLDGVAILSNRFTVLRNKERVLTIALLPTLETPLLPPAEPGAAVRGCFVFSASNGRQWDLYTYTPATDSLTNVTRTTGGNEVHPRFSPDGRLIAFQSNRDGFGLDDLAYDVYVLEPSGIRRLTTRIGWTGSGVAWSPDGSELLASVEQWKDGDPFPPWTNWQEIWRIPLQGGKPALVPSLSQPNTFYITPDWHRSSGVVLAKYDAPMVYKDLFVAQLERDQPAQQLTDTRSRHAGNIEPRWSPDGQWVWFASERNSQGIFRLYAIRADGTSLQPRFHEAAEDRSPVPIENGTRIAFVRHPTTGPRLMIANPETSTAQTLKDLSSLNVKEVQSLDWTAFDGFAENAKPGG